MTELCEDPARKRLLLAPAFASGTIAWADLEYRSSKDAGKATRGEEAMSRAQKPTKNSTAQVRALVNRQVQAWEKRDFDIAADDWLPNGELFFPGGHVGKEDIQRAILNYFKDFTHLKVTVNEMFLSADGTRLAIQWDWTVTRKRDRKRATTHDAILVHLVGGKIATWSEYFGRPV